MIADTTTAPDAGPPAPGDIARLRLVCLVRSGDGYVVRAVGRLADAGDPGDPGVVRRHLDITFGDAADRARAAELDLAVRQVQRWCDDGTTVALIDTGARLAFRGADGTEVTLPRSA